jgi:hypothetical protein
MKVMAQEWDWQLAYAFTQKRMLCSKLVEIGYVRVLFYIVIRKSSISKVAVR